MPFRIQELYRNLPVSFRERVRLLVPGELRRALAHRNTDVYLISYPKCGRTWLRLMIGRAISTHFHLPEDEEILFLRSNRRFHSQVPRITVVHEDRPMLKAPEELATDKHRFRNKKVIFLARDPRDVIVSSYFEMTRRDKLFGENPYEKRQKGFEGSLPEFIAARVGGYETLLTYYNIWAANRNIPAGFLLVRYEDLKANPKQQLRRILDFLGLDQVTDDEIAESVGYASFENMRKMEARGQFQSGMLKPGDTTNPESFKTRKGKVQGYVDYLAQDQIQALNDTTNKNLSKYFGYSAPEGSHNERIKHDIDQES